MVAFVRIISENFNLKKTKKNLKNIFTIYSPKKAVIVKPYTLTIDTGLSIKLPENSTAFIATKFEGQQIQKIICPSKKRLWITLLNESYFNKYQINKRDIIGFLVIEPDKTKTHYEAKEKTSRRKNKCPDSYLPKYWSKRYKRYFQKIRGHLVVKQEDFSTDMTLSMQAEMLLIKTYHKSYWTNKQSCTTEN